MPGKTVLVADDDDNIRTSIKDILELEGYTVYEADNGVKTLSLYEAVQPDLLVLDIMMPEMDGASLSFELNSRFSGKKTPIIFISGMLSRNVQQVNSWPENTVYLPKPFAIPELLALVKKSLG
jgi:DNA-binding response OmpR family regulator